MVWNKTNPMPRKNRDSRYINDVEIGLWFTKTPKVDI